MDDCAESKAAGPSPALNVVEAIYCFVVVLLFSLMALLISITERPREPTLQAFVLTLFGCLLALMPVGVMMELVYRRWKVHRSVVLCIMITVVMWMLFAAMLFPDR